MKKLIPAIVMLLVSAILMSTASYAWFSANNKVTATGMTVNVTSPVSLLIAPGGQGKIQPSNSAYVYNIDLTGTAGAEMDELLPSVYAKLPADWSIDGNQGLKFHTINTTTSINKVNAAGKIIEDITDPDGTVVDSTEVVIPNGVDPATVTSYINAARNVNDSASAGNDAVDAFAYGVFYLKLAGGAAATNTDINAAVSITLPDTYTNGGDLYKALTIAFLVMTPGTSSQAETAETSLTASYEFIAEKAIDDTVGVAAGAGYKTYTLNFEGIIDDMTIFAAEVGHEVTMYIWYDGNHDSCNNLEAISVKEATISVAFTATENP